MTESSSLRTLRTINLLLILGVFCSLASGKVIYVNDDAVGVNDGTSWDNAYIYLQDALAKAIDLEKPVEIRVAQGVYRPNQNSDTPDETGERSATFRLINGVTLKGGYASIAGLDPNTRNFELYETTLSGDLNSDDEKVANPYDLLNEKSRAENSHHVVTSSGTNETAVLDGFTITGGNADTSYPYGVSGGGMYNNFGDPTIANCSFRENSAIFHGGGVYNNSGSPTLTDCNFIENLATWDGGGMYNEAGNPTLTDCTFRGNSGGGMYNDARRLPFAVIGSSPTLVRCKFIGNYGYGMVNGSLEDIDGFITGSTSVLTDCTFSGNYGCGMMNFDSSSTLIDCTFSHNFEGGMSNYMSGKLFHYDFDSHMNLTGCNFKENLGAWNGGGGIYNEAGGLTLTNCSFRENSSIGNGGGICNKADYVTLTVCRFSGNSAERGGGMYNKADYVTLTGCKFSGNSAEKGGGMYNEPFSRYSEFNCYFTNCLFSGNRADIGGGMYNSCNPILTNCTFSGNYSRYEDGLANEYGNPILVNCILWDEKGEPSPPSGGGRGSTGMGSNSIIRITYSDIRDYWRSEGNISVDPCFADPGYWAHANDPNIEVEPNDPNTMWIDGDYHLKSQTGRWNPNILDWVEDNVTSLCINAGDPRSPVGEEPVPNGERINMGFYGGTSQASKSLNDVNNIPPDHASNPIPADGTLDVDSSITLKWINGFNAVSHDVYFGPDNPPPFIRNQTALEFDYTIDPNTQYFWRIDEIDSLGNKTIGDIWTFTTEPYSHPPKQRCFTGKTLVWIDGTLIPISKVGFGKRIDSFGRSSEIEEIQEHQGTFTCYDVILDSGNCISVADNHYFMAEYGQWLSLHSLHAGTRLKTTTGSVEIVKILKRPKPYTGKVYNIKVAGSDQYMVGKDGVVVRDY